MKPNAAEKRLLAGERAQTRHREREHAPEANTRQAESSKERACTERNRARSRGARKHTSTSGEERDRQKTSIDSRRQERTHRGSRAGIQQQAARGGTTQSRTQKEQSTDEEAHSKLARNIEKTEGIGSRARAAKNAEHARERVTGGAITKRAKGGTEQANKKHREDRRH